MARTPHLRVSWSETKCAFAGIRNRYTEHTAARARGPIQTPRKPIAFGASARHSKNPKLLTVSHGPIRAAASSACALVAIRVLASYCGGLNSAWLRRWISECSSVLLGYWLALRGDIGHSKGTKMLASDVPVHFFCWGVWRWFSHSSAN